MGHAVGYGSIMLVLNRKLNQSIVIADNITIKVLEIKNGSVRLGITAPADTQVNRLEIYEAKRKGENGND